MDNLFLGLLLISSLAIIIFGVLSLMQFVKKNKPNGMKQLKLTGGALIIFVISFVGFAVTMEPTTATNEDKTEVAKEKETTKKSEKPKTEEKIVVEEETDEEETVETTAPVALTWQFEKDEIENPEKYDAVVLYAREYQATEEEVKEFEKYIIAEYQSKNYLADITNAEYMLSNIFRANVIQRSYDDNAPVSKFAFDFEQNTKYTYRGADAVDSESVKSNESQMDKSLAKME